MENPYLILKYLNSPDDISYLIQILANIHVCKARLFHFPIQCTSDSETIKKKKKNYITNNQV